MPKRAVSWTIEESNLVWLKGVAERSGARSVSETVDRLLTAARESGGAAGLASRSVVGSIDLAADDKSLADADAAVRGLFAESVSRPVLVKERSARYRPTKGRRG